MPKLCVPRALLLLWMLSAQAKAATFLVSYGALEGKEKQRDYFYTLELSQNKNSLTDFEITSLNHAKGETKHDSVEVLSRGLGFEFAMLRLSADAGFSSRWISTPSMRSITVSRGASLGLTLA